MLLRRRPAGILPPPPADATTFLTLYLLLLLGLPSRLIIGPLGGAGTPAQILGILGMGWWVWHWLAQPNEHPLRSFPVRRAMLCLVAAILASYVAAMMRPISPSELNSIEMGLLSMTSWLGVFLVASHGIPNRARLETALRRLSLGGGILAGLGILQFVTGRPFTDLVQIPGLTANTLLVSVRDREGFNRPAGTALHPIEFGTALTILLPICLYFAFQPGPASKLRRWLPVVLIGLAIPLSISRSAIVAAVVVLAFLMPTWTAAARRMALIGIAFGGAAIFLAVPGMLGTITGLFTGISRDSSALSRTDSYALAWEFIMRSPFFGRGFLTFLPEYRILDNQYLGLLIDCGFLGMFALVACFATVMWTTQRVRAASEDAATRALARGMTASVAAAAVSYAFFDGFSFPLLAGLTFLVIGCAAAFVRLASDPLCAPGAFDQLVPETGVTGA